MAKKKQYTKYLTCDHEWETVKPPYSATQQGKQLAKLNKLQYYHCRKCNANKAGNVIAPTYKHTYEDEYIR